MRKLILVLGILLLISGCTSAPETSDDRLAQTVENARDVDMSAYDNMSSDVHNFKEITTRDMLDVIDNGGSGIFYLGYSSCPMCNYLIQYINEAANRSDVIVYYIDVYNTEDGFNENLAEVIEKLDAILSEYEGEKVVMTPHVFSVVNGEFYDSVVGGMDGYDGTDETSEVAIERYMEVFEPFA